jgi:hypothetical protein
MIRLTKYAGILAILLSAYGCQLERGKLYFDELGLDPITLYQMNPMEKTMHCLYQAQQQETAGYNELYTQALQAFSDNPLPAWRFSDRQARSRSSWRWNRCGRQTKELLKRTTPSMFS